MARILPLLLSLISLHTTSTYSTPSSTQSVPVDVDIAIIGGGASGSYAAVRLHSDFNKRILLIEPRPRLGGSVSTYLVPETNTTLEFGVQSYLPYGPALDFFARFGIDTVPFSSKRLTPVNVDAETEELLEEYVAPSLNATNEAFAKWLEIVSKYEKYMEPGYWEFPLPEDIPADLLTRFADFAKENGVEAAVPRILLISGVGYGGVEDLLTFEIVQAFGAALTKDMIEGTLVRPVGSNSLLYERIYDSLKSNILLSSTVQDVEYLSDGKIQLTIQQTSPSTPTITHIITAKRILFAAPPSLTNLSPFHPDPKQTTVFSQLTQGAEYIGVASIPCIPENATITYMPSTAAPANYLALKNFPYNLRLDSTGPTGLGLDLFRVVFGANYTMSTSEFQNIVERDVRKLRESGTFNSTQECKVDWKATSDHSRPLWKLSAEQLKGGFVQDLYGLQGYGGIWYTGYAWAAPYSSTIWGFTEDVVGRLVRDLEGV